jgi:hypothetical protein
MRVHPFHSEAGLLEGATATGTRPAIKPIHRQTDAAMMTTVSPNMHTVITALMTLEGGCRVVQKRGTLMMPAAIVVVKTKQRGKRVQRA